MKPGWLYGWKDIAYYVGCDPSTIKRYAKTRVLPIYHLHDSKPMAKIDEIDHCIKKTKIIQEITKLRQK